MKTEAVKYANGSLFQLSLKGKWRLDGSNLREKQHEIQHSCMYQNHSGNLKAKYRHIKKSMSLCVKTNTTLEHKAKNK